ncbi:hypothetical protein B0T10DRAFT_532644 [Thelonectria olida]|uniref:Rhodopsin domain-containing protein n=1 Tax=Thelonectria olida TaxID=1576542 RepID=A0A9P9AK58_9HYPO|nr:hypothetical protein B0T10DRAFT_532644 [Thelonectria olida]
MAVDPNATTVTPTGLALVLLSVSLFFVAPSAIVVILRCSIRFRHGVFALDDGLMLVGWVLFVCLIGTVSHGSFVGIGLEDDKLNTNMQRNGRMYMWLFQVIYCSSLPFIKGSICVTLLRIAVQKNHRIIVQVVLAVSCISPLIVIIGLLTMCRPISAGWDGSVGKCSPPIVITSLSYLVSAAAVATDWTCAILPGFMLYRAQMKRATKISISVILGLGVVASIATIARLPYISSYGETENYLYNIANIVLWSIVESGTGIIAGSLPSLRRLVKNWINFDSTNGSSPAHITPYTGTNRGTVTSKVGATTRTRSIDDASSSHKIYVKVDVEMQSLERPATSTRSNGSMEEFRMPVQNMS